MLGVSAETVRRDLVALERRGALVRVHGGATNVGAGSGEEAPFAERAYSAAGRPRRPSDGRPPGWCGRGRP